MENKDNNITNKEYKELIVIANYVYKKLFRKYTEHYEDLISCGVIQMCRYYNNYDDSKGAKITYLYDLCKSGMLRFIDIWYHFRRKDYVYNVNVSLYTPVGEEENSLLADLLPGKDFDFESNINIDYIKKIVFELIEKIPQKTSKGKVKYLTKQKCVKLYMQYFDFTKVANILGISKQCVEIYLSQFRELLKERLLKEGFYCE